jgi:cytochrome c
MKSIMLAAIIAAGFVIAGTAGAQEELAKSSGCLGCHAIDTKKMGPAFKDVAAKYKGKADAEATLVAKVSEAKGHPKVKADADVKTLVHWVLSL